VSITRANLGDLPRMLAIERASHPQPWTETGLREEIERDSARGETWVLHEDGVVAAFVILWFIVDEMQVQNVSTDPARRRRGHARALLRCALHRAEVRGCTKVTLEVRASNTAALALYESFRFDRVGLRPRYYSNGDDAVLMEVRT
jgi:[ribosomal protein S18]-alanine N-acetyltransferase